MYVVEGTGIRFAEEENNRRGFLLGWEKLLAETAVSSQPARAGSTDKRPGRCRSRKRDSPSARETLPGWSRAARWSGKKCTFWHPLGRVRRKLASGRRPGNDGNSRTNPAAAVRSHRATVPDQVW